MENLPFKQDLETKKVLRLCAEAERRLGELKSAIKTIPNEEILLTLLPLQEAQASSEIESIVTTTDELYKAQIESNNKNTSIKEVNAYSQALLVGWKKVIKDEMLTNNTICQIQEIIEGNNAGFRTQQGTVLKNNLGETIYTPPQDAEQVKILMANLEQFINDDSLSELNPLIKMALIHHQFESIHPFYDGNGRVGRIINILYLSLKNRLDLPILYLSRFIISHKDSYYKLLQETREKENWQEWIIFILKGIIMTSLETLYVIKKISILILEFKKSIKENYSKIYSQDLVNMLFKYPYTKVSFVMRELKIHRETASRYLNILCEQNLLKKHRIGRTNYYFNQKLINAFIETRERLED